MGRVALVTAPNPSLPKAHVEQVQALETALADVQTKYEQLLQGALEVAGGRALTGAIVTSLTFMGNLTTDVIRRDISDDD